MESTLKTGPIRLGFTEAMCIRDSSCAIRTGRRVFSLYWQVERERGRGRGERAVRKSDAGGLYAVESKSEERLRGQREILVISRVSSCLFGFWEVLVVLLGFL